VQTFDVQLSFSFNDSATKKGGRGAFFTSPALLEGNQKNESNLLLPSSKLYAFGCLAQRKKLTAQIVAFLTFYF